MKIGYQTLCWQTFEKEFSIEEVIKEIKKAGFSGIEFCESLEKLGDAQELKALLSQHQMEMVSLSCSAPQNMDDEQGFKVIKDRINYAAKFGIKALMVCGFFVRKPNIPPSKEEFVKAANVLDDVSKYARDKGMDVAFHNHLGCIVENYQELEMLLDLVKVAKICLDTAHFVATGSDCSMFLRNHSDSIAYLHLKDWKKEKNSPGGGRFVELGQGNVHLDFPSIFKTLKEINFSDWAAVELDKTERTPLESAKISRKYLESLEVM